jgi:hypothetical protein
LALRADFLRYHYHSLPGTIFAAAFELTDFFKLMAPLS